MNYKSIFMFTFKIFCTRGRWLERETYFEAQNFLTIINIERESHFYWNTAYLLLEDETFPSIPLSNDHHQISKTFLTSLKLKSDDQFLQLPRTSKMPKFLYVFEIIFSNI